MSTTMIKTENVQRKWHVIDASNNVLGRVATIVASILMGKHLVNQTKHVDMGDFVIIVNSSKILLTGNKLNQKVYYKHSGWVGGLKEKLCKKLMNDNKSDFIIYNAVKGMLPKNKIGNQAIKRLKIFKENNHIHQAQNPITMNILKK